MNCKSSLFDLNATTAFQNRPLKLCFYQVLGSNTNMWMLRIKKLDITAQTWYFLKNLHVYVFDICFRFFFFYLDLADHH